MFVRRHLYKFTSYCICYTRIRLFSQYEIAKPLLPRKGRAPGNTSKRFIDFRKVQLHGGNGGDGCLSFLSLPRNEFAGPDGGDGGHGAHIIFIADLNEKSLEKVNVILRGAHGVDGGTKNCYGKNAQHLYIKVPLGTIVRNEEGTVIADLEKMGDLFIGARGGAGGHGNRYFLSNEDRAPMTYEKGAIGEERNLVLELRIMAHAGLVGFPNAGKSTLLRAISRARPKVAAYPFTTLNPHVGMVHYEDLIQLAVADIPGLVRGAHLNRGLGFSFLRHIQRCRCLLYVLDLSDDAPWQQLDDLRYELEQYHPGLSQRPHAIVANKIDLVMAEEKLGELRERIGADMPIFAIRAKKHINMNKLLEHLRWLYDQNEHNL